MVVAGYRDGNIRIVNVVYVMGMVTQKKSINHKYYTKQLEVNYKEV